MLKDSLIPFKSLFKGVGIMNKNKRPEENSADEMPNKHEHIFVQDEYLRIAKKYAQDSVNETMKAVHEKLKKELDK